MFGLAHRCLRCGQPLYDILCTTPRFHDGNETGKCRIFADFLTKKADLSAPLIFCRDILAAPRAPGDYGLPCAQDVLRVRPLPAVFNLNIIGELSRLPHRLIHTPTRLLVRFVGLLQHAQPSPVVTEFNFN